MKSERAPISMRARQYARSSPWVVGVVSLVFALTMMLKVMGGPGGDITIFLAFGEEATEITEHAEQELEREVFLRLVQGHDGKYFFLQAADPLYLDPDQHAVLLDRPVYRAQRMLYPLIAGAFGAMPITLLPWSMVIVNVLAIGIGGLGTAKLSTRLGANPWWGLTFPLNIGLLFEFAISGAGIVAFAAAVWAFLALEEERFTAAAMLLTASVLAREAMFLSVVGVLWLARRRTGRWQLPLILWPAGAAGTWALYIRSRLDSGVTELEEIGFPFGGIVEAIPTWRESPLDLLVAGMILALIVVFVMRTLRSNLYLAWGSVGFAALAVLLTRQVWLRQYNITRAVAPLLTAFVIVTFAAAMSDDNERERSP